MKVQILTFSRIILKLNSPSATNWCLQDKPCHFNTPHYSLLQKVHLKSPQAVATVSIPFCASAHKRNHDIKQICIFASIPHLIDSFPWKPLWSMAAALVYEGHWARRSQNNGLGEAVWHAVYIYMSGWRRTTPRIRGTGCWEMFPSEVLNFFRNPSKCCIQNVTAVSINFEDSLGLGCLKSEIDSLNRLKISD